jgi:methionyl-tRNA formyltransferase
MKLLAGQVILRTVRLIEKGDISLSKQNDENASPAPKLFREDCQIDWDNPVEIVYNLIRGLSPYPTAWTDLQGNTLKIFRADVIRETHQFIPGTFHTDSKSYLHFAARDGFIACREVQLQGKRKLSVNEFLNGYKLQ